MVNAVAMPKIIRDRASCNQCLRCNNILHGFSNMSDVVVDGRDFEKEEVQLIIDRMILICETASISIEL